jgi:hypothetical protein
MAQRGPHSRKHINPDAEAAKRRDLERVSELVDLGDEDTFVSLIKTREPAISPSELLKRIELFRELKRLRSRGV